MEIIIPKSLLIVMAFVILTLATLAIFSPSNKPLTPPANNSQTIKNTSSDANTSLDVNTGSNANPGSNAGSSPADNPGTVSASQNDIVILVTSKGNITIELYPSKAPLSVQNFESYVRSGFYDGAVFHRVIFGFMIQGGGFTPNGDKKLTNAPIRLESDNGLSNTVGTIAMARTSNPDSATSQFFINTVDNPELDHSSSNPGYAVFGKVVSGMDVVKAIESVPTGSKGQYSDWPLEDVVMLKAIMQ